MKKIFPQISYDKESEALSIKVGDGKSVDSDVKGNVVIDYDKNDDIVRINLYKFNFDAFQENLSSLKQFTQNSRAALFTQ